MNRFIFRLQNVLRLREIKEDEKKREFGAAMRDLHHEEKKLEQLGDTLQNHENNMVKRGQGKVTARELQNNFYYARSLDEKIENQTGNVKKHEEIVDDKREELAEKTKEKKILERLKERRREEHDQAVQKEEQALIDDITSVRHKWNNESPPDR